MNAIVAHTDHALRQQIAVVLEGAAWTVHCVDDPDAALDACRRSDGDVVLVDLALPGGATELLERVKRDPELFRTAVVLLSEALEPGDVVTWLGRGADDVLRVPVDPADLLGRVFAAARTKALVKELTAQNDRLEELVFFDELTSLRNRRAVLNELEMLVAGARRHGHALSLLMLDIDRFKPINDRYGHRAGDDVLREVSRRLRGRLRKEDIGGRLGGDELLVILPNTDAEGAATAAESIRAAVAGRPVRTSAGPIEVTVSIGSAAWAGEDLAALLERADSALYAAKTSGRNATAA
jgi:two-component system cell cycle response regulator